MSSKSTLVSAARGVSYLWLQNIISTAARIVAFVFFARLISVAEMGIYIILSLAYNGAAVIVGLGLSSIVTKLIAENVAQRRKETAASVYYISLCLSQLVSVAVAAVFLLFGFPAGVSSIQNSQLIMIIGVLFVIDVLGFIGPIEPAAFFGLLEFKDYALINTTYLIIRPFMVVLLVYQTHSLVGLVEAWLISDWGLGIYMLFYLWRKLGPPVFHFKTKHLLKLSSPLYLASASLFLYSYFDQLTLIPFGSLAALGIYGAAVTAFTAYSAFIALLGTVLLPVMSGEHGVRGPEALQGMIRTASRYVSIVGMPLAFALLATAKPALVLLVGVPYESGSIPLAVLALGSTATIVATPLMTALIVLNETKQAALASIIPIPFAVLVALLSIPVLGILGVSIARALSMLFSFLLTWYFLRQQIIVKLDSSAIFKSTVASSCMALVTVGAQIIYYNKFLLPIYLLVALLTYLFALRLLKAIGTDDLELAERILGPRFIRICNLLLRLVVT